MVRYAARAVPWARVALAAILVVLLMELVRWNPWVLWPLEGTAIGLLAGATAWCFDEAAAVVVDVAPRSLAWRTAARMPAVLGLALVWCAVVWHAGDGALFGRSSWVLVQGLAALTFGAAYAEWRRACGEPMPGLLLATTIVPLTSAWALVRPFEATLPVFPYGSSSASDWAASTAGWVTLGILASVALLVALTDALWWSARIRRSTQRPSWRSTYVITPHPTARQLQSPIDSAVAVGSLCGNSAVVERRSALPATQQASGAVNDPKYSPT